MCRKVELVLPKEWKQVQVPVWLETPLLREGGAWRQGIGHKGIGHKGTGHLAKSLSSLEKSLDFISLRVEWRRRSRRVLCKQVIRLDWYFRGFTLAEEWRMKKAWRPGRRPSQSMEQPGMCQQGWKEVGVTEE